MTEGVAGSVASATEKTPPLPRDRSFRRPWSPAATSNTVAADSGAPVRPGEATLRFRFRGRRVSLVSTMKELLRDTRVQRLLIANTLGSIGSGVTIFAVPWLLVNQPGGNAAFRWITIATTIVLFLLMPYYGAWVDHHSRKTALLASEAWGFVATLAMALVVLGATIYYGIKIKGLGGFIHELFCAPFGSHPALWLPNLLLNLIEYLAKMVSLGMRLFGNMYAGELLFFLIALMGGYFAMNTTGLLLAFTHVFAGTAWLLFHVLIVVLQAFIFMMLTLVYIGQAHEGH